MNVQMGETISKREVKAYSATTVDGKAVVNGQVAYDKDDKVVDCNGRISDENGNQIANFNVFGSGESLQVNMTDCDVDVVAEAAAIAKGTLEAL